MYDKKDSWWFWDSDYFLCNWESLETFEYAILLASFQKRRKPKWLEFKQQTKPQRSY